LPEQRSPSRRFLPPDPRVATPYRLTPGLALRIGILGTIVLAVFAVLFLRLWALQVLSGDRYLNAAQNNQLRTIRVQAPRGPILDRNGLVIVDNAAGNSVQLWPADLPDEETQRAAVLKRLSRVLDVPVGWMERQIAKRGSDPLTPIVVKRGVHDDHVFYIAERPEQFPGVQIATSYLRRYPYKALGAQLLGHVGEVSRDQLEASDDPGLAAGDEVGQAGVESVYDEFLRGRTGSQRLRVDSLGRPLGERTLAQESQPGYALRLTVDVRLQQAAERALRYGIQQAHATDEWYANGGAIVAMDPRNGEILAMASNPTFRPDVFVGRVEQRKLAAAGLTQAAAEQKNFPALNRALAGVYPPGSTWKPVTALAGMEEHILSPYSTLPCTPSYVYEGENGVDYPFDNWTTAFNIGMTLPQALEASCNTYFYEVGRQFYELPPERGHPFQNWARRFGFGEPTGVELGGEATGLLPTPEWRKRAYAKSKDPLDRVWKPGDSIQLAIGQKDLLVTPLQMARFYSLIANGGKLVTPRIAIQAERTGQAGGQPDPVQRFTAPVPQPINVDAAALDVVREGLYLATHGVNGTATGVFGSYPIKIAGKTGTAQKVVDGVIRDQSWWCGYAPADNPTVTVCAMIENGGHGGSAAAPAALKVFEQYFHRAAGAIAPSESD
jgi:penicillin-binding protein 2